MNQLETIYRLSIEQTKNKVYEDLEKFLGEKEFPPPIQEYLQVRDTYISQIWLNVWLTKSTNDFSKREKKEFLSHHGFIVEGIDKKIINKLFRNEMRNYHFFDAKAWLEKAVDGISWDERHQKARKRFLKEKAEVQILEQKKNVRQQIIQSGQTIIRDFQESAYLKIRHEAAKELIRIFQESTRYEPIDPFMLEERLTEIGSFHAEDYATIADFSDELTGQIHQAEHWGQRLYEYETYEYYLENWLKSYFENLGSEAVLKGLSGQLLDSYEKVFEDKLTQPETKRMLSDVLDNYLEYYLHKLHEEYVSDLVDLAAIPFDKEIHEQMYEQDLADRERRKAEELAEVERKNKAHAEMMEDIFGMEYDPSQRRNITYVLHIGETNTGKTHQALERMKQARSGLYLAPLRLLALEVYDKLNNDGIACSLKTGEEEKLVEGAVHISCTVEMFHEKDYFQVVVIDESQMIADKDRGFSWYKAITKANAEEVHIIGSKNSKTLLLELLGGNVEVIEYSRDIPLMVENKEFSLNQTHKGDALVCFSRRQVLENASKLQKNGHQVSMIYGSMPPETRQKQIQRFIKGETTVVVATDAIGMGLNLPIRRIVFLENEKFDGTRRRRLTSQEIKQIAGRAGRKGLYNTGKVAFTSEINLMKKLLEKDDQPIEIFSIAPTAGIFERFQKYHRSLGIFFELWDLFESPKGTKKASLAEERDLYEYVRDTEIEARLSMMDLYGFLHLPFASREQDLIEQWLETIQAIVAGVDLPEPVIKSTSLEELELSYKAIGLHLLFLYKLDRRTEAVYWERIRTGLSDDVHEYLKTEVKNYQKKCRHCGKALHADSPYQICDSCHGARSRRRSEGRNTWR